MLIIKVDKMSYVIIFIICVECLAGKTFSEVTISNWTICFNEFYPVTGDSIIVYVLSAYNF